jgi:hypothetical protein
MLHSWKHRFAGKQKQTRDTPVVTNDELLRAMALRNQAENPQTLKDFYDALWASTLLAALPLAERGLANSFVDCLRRGDEFTLIGQPDEQNNAIWYIFTDEAALRRWMTTPVIKAPVPALDILRSAAKNRITVAINPADRYPTYAYLNLEEIQALSEGRYPTAAQGNNSLSGSVMQIFPPSTPPSKFLQKALRRTLRHKSAIVNAYIFNAQIGYQGQYRCLGLEFDARADEQLQRDICTQLRYTGSIPPMEAAELVIFALWDEIKAEVALHGVNVYSRKRSGPHRYGAVPEGCKLEIGYPSPVAGIWKLASGIRLIDFGPATLNDPTFLQTVRTSFEQDPISPVFWVLQGSAIAAFPLDPASLQRWLHTLHQLRQLRARHDEQAKDCFIVEAATKNQHAFLQVLATLGVVLQRAGPDGELFVEIHQPQGITIRFPGLKSIQLAPECCVVQQANVEKDRLAATGDPRLAEVEREERNAIAGILARALAPGEEKPNAHPRKA